MSPFPCYMYPLSTDISHSLNWTVLTAGMDEFDSDMVKEELDREFPYGVSGAPATAHKMVTINTNVHDSTMSNNPTSALRSPGNRSTNSTVNTFSSHTVKHHIEEVRSCASALISLPLELTSCGSRHLHAALSAPRSNLFSSTRYRTLFWTPLVIEHRILQPFLISSLPHTAFLTAWPAGRRWGRSQRRR